MLKLHPSTLRCLFEDGQKTRALMEIRVLDSSTGETQGSSLASVVHKAGEQCCSSVRIGGEKPADDVSVPSIMTPNVRISNKCIPFRTAHKMVLCCL